MLAAVVDSTVSDNAIATAADAFVPELKFVNGLAPFEGSCTSPTTKDLTLSIGERSSPLGNGSAAKLLKLCTDCLHGKVVYNELTRESPQFW